MKSSLRLCLFFGIAIGVSAGSLIAQEDLSRTDGLPSKIGGPTCNGPAGRTVASIAGNLNVVGTIAQGAATPNFSVSVWAGGMFIARRKVKNGGYFSFYCVPAENVMLVGEVDGSEVASVPIGMLSGSPVINRQDVTINWSGVQHPKQGPGLVSARSAYERGKENQRLFDKALDEIQAKKVDAASDILEKLVKNDPRDWPAWTTLGNLHFNNNEFEQAMEDYEQALSIKNDHLAAMIGAGRSYLNLKKTDRAVEVLKTAYETNPNSADVNHYLGEAYFQMRKGSLGIPLMKKAIEIAPAEKAELHLRIAALYSAAGAKDIAATEYKLFLEKRPNHPDRQKMERFISENSR